MRYTVISPEGLFTYRNVNNPYTYCVKAGSVKYLWSRFDFH